MGILESNGFISVNDGQYTLTIKGLMASQIHEVHSMALTDVIASGKLNALSVEEIVSVLSVFTNIKLSEADSYGDVEYCNVSINTKDVVKSIKQELDKYYDLELKYQTAFTQDYTIHYNMCEFMIQWCHAQNEDQCRQIYSEAKQYNIYLGEFIKAILKINNICEEMEKVCQVQENVELLHKLSMVREKTLKSIATNQSLYL